MDNLEPERGTSLRCVAVLSLAPLLAGCIAGAKNAVNMTGAYRSVSGDFKEASGSPAVGLEGLWGVSSDGIGLEGGYLYSEAVGEDSAEDETLATNELFGGVRKTWNTKGRVQPYLAAGVNWITGDASAPLDVELSGSGLGLYVRGGVGFQVGLFQIGADLRTSLSYAKVGDETLSYVQGALFMGVSF